MRIVASRQRIISPEPWVIRLIKKRKTIIYRPFREIYLDFAEDVARQLRSRDFWVSMTASTIAHVAISFILGLIGISKTRRW